MTLNDDRSFLLRHLRNSFVVSDDTGVSEMVIEPDLIMESKIRASISSEADLDAYSQSPDVVAEVELGAARLRSSTVLRLQKLKEDSRSKAKVKSVRIVDSSAGIGKAAASGGSNEDLFFKKQVICQTASSNGKRKTSLLSKLVADIAVRVNENPFNEYAKFDGKATFNVLTKSIDIFLPFLSVKAERSFPMPVVVVATAKVRELIGLICWQYAGEQRLPALTAPDLSEFRLHLVEDDGEVDSDFPPLDGGEPISKFGFARLALVHRRPAALLTRAVTVSSAAHDAHEPTAELAAVAQQQQQQQQTVVTTGVSAAARLQSAGSSHGQQQQQQQRVAGTSSGRQVLVTVYDADQCSTKLRCDSDQVTLRDVVSMALAKRGSGGGAQSADGWRLERLAQLGHALPHEMSLAMAGVREFRLIQEARRPVTPARQPSAAAVQSPTVGRPKSEASSAAAAASGAAAENGSGHPTQQQQQQQQQQRRTLPQTQAGQGSSAAAATAATAAEVATTATVSPRSLPAAATPRQQPEQAALGSGGGVTAAVSRRLVLDYKSYSVSMVQVQKLFFTKYDVLLGVSAERIEIHPMSHKSALKLLFRQKAVTIDASCLADCQLVDDKQSGKAQFRLTYLGGNDFRQYEFEADQATAREIVQVIKDIIEIRDMQDMKERQQTAPTKSPITSRRNNNLV